MLNRLLILSLAMTLFSCGPASPPVDKAGSQAPTADTSGYDAELARKLGADPYGMKRYVMAFLKRGPHPSADSTPAARLQRAHLDNITRLAEEGKLVMAGPFLDDGAVRGIYIFDVETLEEARQLTETDPSIQAGALEMELRPWYGSAALLELNRIHQRVQAEDI